MDVVKYLKRSANISRLVFLIVVALVIITYNLSSVWKSLHLAVFKVKVHTIIEDYHGNYDNMQKTTGQRKKKIENYERKDDRTSHQTRKDDVLAAKEHNRKPAQTHEWDKRNRVKLCGSGWQDKYARLHSEVVASRKKEKYLAYTCPGNRQGCCGYGNRLRAVVSLFYLAILTDRAFLIDWKTPEPIENHLKPKRIQWNHSSPLDICAGLETRRHYWGTASAQLREAEGWIIQDSKHFKNWFTGTNLSSYFDTPVEEVTTIWYFVEGGVNQNPYLMRRAKELNITPLISSGVPKYALIGCAFDFLFEKSNEVENLLQMWRDEVRRAGEPIIGIHIRTGDLQFDYFSREDDRLNNLKNLTRLHGFFKCARHVEQKIFKLNESANNALWFLATDNNDVKKYAREIFPGKVITTNLTIQHLDILHNTTMLNETIECNFTTGVNGSAFCYNVIPFNKTLFCANRTNNTAINDNSTIVNDTHQYANGIIAMLVEHFILSECDFLILCDSSFSSTAVGLSMRGDKSYIFGDRDCLRYKEAQKLKKMRFFRKKRSIRKWSKEIGGKFRSMLGS